MCIGAESYIMLDRCRLQDCVGRMGGRQNGVLRCQDILLGGRITPEDIVHASCSWWRCLPSGIYVYTDSLSWCSPGHHADSSFAVGLLIAGLWTSLVSLKT